MILVIHTDSVHMYPSLNPNTMQYEGAFRPQSAYQGERTVRDVAQLTGSELNIQEGVAMDTAGFEQMPDPKYFGACEGCADSEIFERPNVYSKKKNSAPPLPDLKDALEDEEMKKDNEEEKNDPRYYQTLLRRSDKKTSTSNKNGADIEEPIPPAPRKPTVLSALDQDLQDISPDDADEVGSRGSG